MRTSVRTKTMRFFDAWCAWMDIGVRGWWNSRLVAPRRVTYLVWQSGGTRHWDSVQLCSPKGIIARVIDLNYIRGCFLRAEFEVVHRGGRPLLVPMVGNRCGPTASDRPFAGCSAEPVLTTASASVSVAHLTITATSIGQRIPNTVIMI